MKTKQRYYQWRFSKVKSRMMREVYGRLYRDSHTGMDRTVLVAGTARSGTTWLADLIASQRPSRVMFEPFNPELIKAYNEFNYFQYLRPEDENDRLESYCERIFSGRIRHPWIDREIAHLNPEYRVVKAIRANLMLPWISQHFPGVPLVLIIRHPCAVVLSRMRLHWATDTDIEAFLSQPRLVADFLSDKVELIRRCTTDEEKHAIIWCISYMVPLKLLDKSNYQLVLYENLVRQPEVEIPRLFEGIGWRFDENIYSHLEKPSTTSLNQSAIVSGNHAVDHWQNELSRDQIQRILDIVDTFGLTHLYSEALLPPVTAMVWMEESNISPELAGSQS